MRRARVCVVTAGQLSTAPRMLKAADALAGAGYDVRVVSTRFLAWAMDADEETRRTRDWAWQTVDYRGGALRIVSRLRQRAAETLAFVTPFDRSLAVAARAFTRVHPELKRAILEAPADLIYGGSTGALAAVAAAGRASGTPYALDLEDFHSAEQDDSPEARRSHTLAGRIERRILAGARFLTTSSEQIAAAYQETYGVTPIAVHNTFPLPATAPDLAPAAPLPAGGGPRPLRLYWFSQTVGTGRGLEEVVQALGLAAIAAELHLRGRPQAGYLESLTGFSARVAPRLAVVHHPPAAPDRMVDLCRGYDVGLAVEQGTVRNRILCLANKPLTYILAGLAVAFTDTPGQRPLALDLGEGALCYPPGHSAALAAGLTRWATDPAALARAQAAAWDAARRRWHWEHPLERGALLAAVAEAVA